ncbi:hypothetical protein JHK84_046934 [Glycine max]|nr:hypothetical protein JHK86_046923 [Glycine max]KAG5101965.1 hypothetical protein JHK84_046934 [Glycine max]
MATWKVAPALAAGCAAILKPSELPSVVTLGLKLFQQIAFTGSSATGSKIMTAAAQLIKLLNRPYLAASGQMVRYAAQLPALLYMFLRLGLCGLIALNRASLKHHGEALNAVVLVVN